MFIGDKEITGVHLGDKDYSGAFLGDKEIWVDELVVYDATVSYNETYMTVNLVSENVNKADYFTSDGLELLVESARGTTPPYSKSGSVAMVKLSQLAKKYKYAKVKLYTVAYASYGTSDITFNGSNINSVSTGSSAKEVTMTMDLASVLNGTVAASVVNNSSNTDYYSKAQVRLVNVTLTNK